MVPDHLETLGRSLRAKQHCPPTSWPLLNRHETCGSNVLSQHSLEPHRFSVQFGHHCHWYFLESSYSLEKSQLKTHTDLKSASTLLRMHGTWFASQVGGIEYRKRSRFSMDSWALVIGVLNQLTIRSECRSFLATVVSCKWGYRSFGVRSAPAYTSVDE